MKRFRILYPLSAGLLLVVTLCLLLMVTPLVGAKSLDDVDVSPGMATITVDTTEDELNSDGDCSLREAIQAANSNMAVDGCAAGVGADTIEIPAGTYVVAIAGTGEDENATGDFDILDDVTLTGAGAEMTIVDGGALDRVFHVHAVTVTVDSLTIANGFLNASTWPAGVGGGLLNDDGNVTVQYCMVRDNVARGGGGLENLSSNGGTATMVVNSSSILSNTINGLDISGLGTGAGIASGPVGIEGVHTTLTVTNSLIADNQAVVGTGYRSALGGGIASFALYCNDCSAELYVISSSVSNNSATAGGGIGGNGEYQTSGDSWSYFYMDRSLVSDNVTRGDGFGMGTGGGVVINGEAQILNSTISGNSALGISATYPGNGGGIWIGTNNFAEAYLTIANSTIVDNFARSGGGGIAVEPLGANAHSYLTQTNTIVAGNANLSGPYNCWWDVGAVGTSLGYNLEDINTCQFDQPTDLVNTDPILGPLMDNGGDTETHALLMGSPALDQGSCPGETSDQRGYPRPVDLFNIANADDGCDIGAYEREPWLVTFSPLIIGTP